MNVLVVPQIIDTKVLDIQLEFNEINPLIEWETHNSSSKFDREFEQVVNCIKDVLGVRWKNYYGRLTLDAIYFNFNERTYTIEFLPNTYFKNPNHIHTSITKQTIYDEFNGDPYCLSLISLIINKKSLYALGLPDIYPEFIKLLFTHLKDVLYWANKYKIVEVFEFIKNLFTLRQPPKIKMLSTYEFIELQGDMKYIEKVLIEISQQSHRYFNNNLLKPDVIQNHMQHINNLFQESKSKQNILRFFMANHLNGKLFQSNFPYVHEILFKNINLRRMKSFFDVLNNSPEADIEILINPNKKIYSHFLWIATGLIEHSWQMLSQVLPDNEYYKTMKNNANLLPSELGKMLMANLYVLNQNV